MRRILLAVFTLLPLAHSALAASAQTCAQYGTISVAGGQYIVQNDVWGATTAQCVTVPDTSVAAFTLTSDSHNQGSVASYPSIFKGCHWDLCTSGSGLPAVYSNISSANFSWSVTRGGSGTWDIAAETWMSTTSNTANGYNGGLELMIWLDSSGMQPAGSQVGTATIAGLTWEVWYANIGWNYVAYRRSGMTSLSANLKDFVDDAIRRGYAKSSWYLSDLEAGTEIMSAGVGFKTNSFSFSPVIGGGGTNYTLSVARSGSGSGTVNASSGGLSCGSSCSASYASGATVTLTASPASGSTFAGWSGACTGTGACVVSMTTNRSVTATFNGGGGTNYTLSVARSGSGSGTVTASNGSLNCGSTCSASYASGATVTLSASAAGGSTFAGWSGACTGSGACVLSMTANRSVTATFNGSGGGGGSCQNAVTFSGNSGNFNTTGAVCLRTSGTVNGWGCSSFDGRTVSVNGGSATSSCGAGPFPLPRSSDGYTYFAITGGTYSWATLYTW